MGNTAAKILTPTNGSDVSGTVSIQTQVSAQVLWEDLYIDKNYIASFPSSFSWESTAVANGPHTITIKAFNRSDALIGGARVAITVDN